MRRNFSFLAEWLPTFLITSFLAAFGSGVLQMAAKFIIPDNFRLQNLAVYIVLTVVICITLAVISTKLGKQLNRTSKPLSTGVPVFNLLICGIVYVVLFIILRGRALGILHLFPGETFLTYFVYGKDGAEEATIFQKTGLCFLQYAVYMADTLVFYLLAKRKQENSEAAVKMRGEKKKPNNRFGIDIDI